MTILRSKSTVPAKWMKTLRPHEKKVSAERPILRCLSVVARGLGGERPVGGGRRDRVASEAASTTSMLRGVVRGIVRGVVRWVARDAVRVCRDSEVASLARGLIEPVVLLMPLRSIVEASSWRSRCATGADGLLPMLRRVHGFVACEYVVGELRARCWW